jgi:hypothetical protein
MYDLLHVLHCSLYIPLELVVFCSILSCSQLCVLLPVRNAIFKLVCLKKLVTLRMRGLWYVRVAHVFLCVLVKVLSLFCVLVILFIRLEKKTLLLAMVQIVFHSCCVA